MSTTVTSSQLFYNKLNESNPDLPYPLTPSNVDVGIPTTNTDESKGKNSVVQVTAKVGSPYSGVVSAYYDRVSLQDIADSAPGSSTFTLTDQTMISDVLAAFNTAFSVNVVLDDIIDGALPNADPATGQISFTLAAAAGSLAFMGTTPLIYKPTDVSLSGGITQTVLTGLTPAYVNAG